MTPLQSRRDEVCRAIAAHISKVGPRDWGNVQAEFPDLPPATFWRCVRQVKRASTPVPDGAEVLGSANDTPDPPQFSRAELDEYRANWKAELHARIAPELAELEAIRASVSRMWATELDEEPRVKPPRARKWGSEALQGELSHGRLMTVAEFMAIYDRDVLSAHRTGVSARRSLAHIVAPLNDKLCYDLKTDDITPIVESMALRAPVHANRSLAYFSAFCTWAIQHGQMEFNPTQEVPRPALEEPWERSLSLSEVVEIWQAAETLGRPFGPAIRLLMLTATRREEVAGMLKRHLVWYEDGCATWWIWQHNHGDQRGFPVPLSPLAVRIVEDAIKVAPPNATLVFTTTGLTPISGWSRAKRRLDAIIRARRLEAGRKPADDPPPWRLNDLRRSFVDLSVEHLDGDARILGRCLNRMTEYTDLIGQEFADNYLTVELRREAIIAWANLIESAVKARAPRRRAKSPPSSADTAPGR